MWNVFTIYLVKCPDRLLKMVMPRRSGENKSSEWTASHSNNLPRGDTNNTTEAVTVAAKAGSVVTALRRQQRAAVVVILRVVKKRADRLHGAAQEGVGGAQG